jgi:hypothetical protein
MFSGLKVGPIDVFKRWQESVLLLLLLLMMMTEVDPAFSMGDRDGQSGALKRSEEDRSLIYLI